MPEWALRAPLRPTAIVSTLATSGDLQSVDPLTTATLSGPSSAQTGVAVTYIITLNVPAAQTYVVTPSCPGATLAPGSFDINAGNSTGQFAVTAPSDGTYSVDFTISPTLTRTGRPISLVAQTSPVTLAYDAQTPHQISINAPHTRTLAEGSTAQVYYRVTGSGSWIDGGYLYRTRTSQGSAANTFAGWVVDLQPGTTYDVRLDVTEPGVGSWQITGTRATRSLPAEGAAQTKSATTANFASVMAGAVAGDVIVLAAGTYTLSGFAWTSPGTSGSPVVIRGSGIGSTILVDSTGTVIDLNGGYVTFEDLTIRGSQVDSGTDATSMGVVMNSGTPTNVCFRRVKFDGCDQGIKVWAVHSVGLLVYDCDFVGNNTWDKTYTIPDGQSYPNLTWNDTGVHMPGDGNCVWNCTFTGHGDTVKLGYQDVWPSRACYIWRNWVKRAGDDGLGELDGCDGNCAIYDNLLANSASGCSADGVASGPVGFFRNVCVNQTRMPIKVTSAAPGFLVRNNTWVSGPRQSGWDYGLYAASGSLADFDWRNNLVIYRGSGALVAFNQSLSAPVTDYCGWYPDNRNIGFGNGTGTWLGLASAKANLAPRMAHDVIVASDPFASPITLGADYTTEYTGHLDARITTGTARNAGVAIAGVTDGYSGAAPDMGAVITGRATPAIGAASDPYVPAWARTQTAQTWAEVPMALTLDDINPITDPTINPNYPGTPEWSENTARQAMIVDAWCGATYDEARDVMWLGLGGGHNDYGGNEIYACNFAAAAPAWRIVRKPSGAIGNLLTTHDGQEATGLYSDGRPRAVHTYNKWAYANGVGPVMIVHGNGSYSAAAGKRWGLFFNEANGEVSGFSAENPVASDSSGLGACYDPSRHAIWYRAVNTSPTYRYTIPTSGGPHTGAAASAVGSSVSLQRYQSLTYLPGFDCILIGHSDEGGSTGGWQVFDCATGTYYTPTFSGSAPMGTTQGKGQPRWVPALAAVCCWNNASNRTQITKLTPGANPRTDAWTVSALPVSGSNTVTPSAATSPGGGSGTYGRFVYSPRMGGFLVFNATTGPTYFYKI